MMVKNWGICLQIRSCCLFLSFLGALPKLQSVDWSITFFILATVGECTSATVDLSILCLYGQEWSLHDFGATFLHLFIMLIQYLKEEELRVRFRSILINWWLWITFRSSWRFCFEWTVVPNKINRMVPMREDAPIGGGRVPIHLFTSPSFV